MEVDGFWQWCYHHLAEWLPDGPEDQQRQVAIDFPNLKTGVKDDSEGFIDWEVTCYKRSLGGGVVDKFKCCLYWFVPSL